MDRRIFFQRSAHLLFFIFVVNFFANKFYWYYSIWYFDMIMHFLGGFWLGLALVYFFVPKDTSLSLIFKTLLFVLFIGIGWEVFEILFNNYIAQNPFDILDTASDIFFDLAGGFCAILYLLVPLENQRVGSKE